MIQAGLLELQLELFLRKREKSQIVWETRSGEKIPINEMSNTHLINTIAMLQKQEDDVILDDLKWLDLNDIC